MGAKILVIDDDYPFVHFAKILLGTLGHQALTALGGSEGIALAKSALPDIILVDVDMPYVDGLEVIRQLKADTATKKIPIILCSITTVQSEVNRAFELGACNFLSKPLNRDECKEKIEQALGTG